MYALATIVVATALAARPITVRPDTLRLVDEYNREVVFHGVNVVVKGPPWIPDTDAFSPLYSFSTKDMEVLQMLGLNAIRLGTMWPGVEPTKGTYNTTYLKALRDLVNASFAYGIYSLLDMHQDVLSEKFCGEGVPLWAAMPNKSSPFPIPIHAAYNVSPAGIPTPTDCARVAWAGYYASAAAGSAFQNLYENYMGLRDSWVQFWATVATYMAPLGSAVLGYELMNEPWAGDIEKDPTLILPGVADRRYLQTMWDVAAAAIRRIDTAHAIFFEGVTWDWFSVGFSSVPGGSAWRNTSVLSYHFYVPPDFSVPTQFRARQDDMKNLGCGGFLTEFSVSADGSPDVMDECDRYGQSWLVWEYKQFRHNKTGYANVVWLPNGSINVPMASKLSRTYAQVVAGITRLSRYDAATRSYFLIFDTDPYVTHNTTVVYLNEAYHYPRGFEVRLTSSAPGGGGVTWTHRTNRVEVMHNMALLKSGTVVVEIFAR